MHLKQTEQVWIEPFFFPFRVQQVLLRIFHRVNTQIIKIFDFRSKHRFRLFRPVLIVDLVAGDLLPNVERCFSPQKREMWFLQLEVGERGLGGLLVEFSEVKFGEVVQVFVCVGAEREG